MILFCLLCYTIPLDSPLMDYVEYLQVRGLVDMPSIRPYELDWLTLQLDELLVYDAQLDELDRKVISLFHTLLTKNEDYSYLMHFSTSYQTAPEYYYAFLDFRQGGKIAPHMRFANGIRFQRASQIDSLGPEPWKDFQGYLSEGLIQWTPSHVRCGIGRRNFLLSHGSTSSLLLSLDPQGYDGYYINIPSRYLHFFSMFSVLDADEYRYYACHRLGFTLKRFLDIGFSEAVVFGNSLEPVYLNMFFPYYLSQWGAGRDDNIIWQIDMQLRIFKTVFYGEFLIDDYIYEDDPNPNKLAFQVGLKRIALNSILADINYTFVDKWVYSQEHRINTYEKDGLCLGFPLGNDVDRISCTFTHINRYLVHPSISCEYTRKGEGSIFLPFEQEQGDLNPPFPSGTVEKALTISAGIDCAFRSMFFLKTTVGRRYHYNADHVDGNDRQDSYFTVTLWGML